MHAIHRSTILTLNIIKQTKNSVCDVDFVVREYIVVSLYHTQGDEAERTLSSQSRDRNPEHVSLPPDLRSIQEQKTLEDSETVEYGKLSPSPIRVFNEGRRIRKKSSMFQ